RPVAAKRKRPRQDFRGQRAQGVSAPRRAAEKARALRKFHYNILIYKEYYAFTPTERHHPRARIRPARLYLLHAACRRSGARAAFLQVRRRGVRRRAQRVGYTYPQRLPAVPA